jgi:FkbM family methyltransferase
VASESKIEVPEQARLTASLLNNVALAAASGGGDGLYGGLAMLRRAIALNPLDLGARLNLANYLLEAGEDGEAEELVTFVLKHDERADIGWQIMGVLETNRGRLEEAIACFARALEIAPHHGQHKFDLAAGLLRAGRWLEGWSHYESRREILPRTGAVPDAPTWQGEKTGHLAIWPDQGHGDLIMFSRFVPWAKERADKVTFLVNPHVLSLFNGFAAIDGVEVTHAYDTSKAKFDHQICCASLPMVFGLTPANVPADPGLISTAKTEGRLGGAGLKIGIAWQGNPQFPGDRMRSIPFREFLPLAADPRNTVYSLQIGPASGDIARARAQRIVRDTSSEVDGEWSHTAAMIKELDLVVSSCTAIPHLAGALGVPTFILLPLFADWRWLVGREDSPWYPHTRLFRQTKVGEWASVMKRVLAAVDELHRRRALVAMLNRHHAPAAVAAGYEPEVADVMRRVLRPGDLFVDVGASEGKHTVPAAELVGPDGKVIAFEPGPQNLPKLRAAVADLDQVEIVERPVAAEEGRGTFFLNRDNENNSLWDPGEFPGGANAKTRAEPHPVEVEFATLDGTLLPRGLAPRLIKIDTEGAEQRVLEGAAALLASKHPPFIVAELHEFGLGKLGCSQTGLRKLMQRAGYEMFLIFSDGSKPRLVPRNARVSYERIINVLFATAADVDAAWPGSPIERPMLHSYGEVGKSSPPLKLEEESAA